MLNTTEIRRMNFEAIFAQVNSLRFAAWGAVMRYGPGTTREIADRSGLDLLTLRPRITELLALGFVELVGRAGREGIYKGRNYAEARQWHESQQEQQLDLKIRA